MLTHMPSVKVLCRPMAHVGLFASRLRGSQSLWTSPLQSQSLALSHARAQSNSQLNAQLQSHSPPPLVLDPPFTAVPGESAALQSLADASCENGTLLYECSACAAPLFCRSAHTHTQCSSAWPSFAAPIARDTLRLRGVRQRDAIPGGSTALRTTMAARGLRIEGDVVRNRNSKSEGNRRERPATWREQCLRDENKRSDPALLEGLCVGCGKPVCRVVTEKRGEVKYVVNPSAVRAVAVSEEQKENENIYPKVKSTE